MVPDGAPMYNKWYEMVVHSPPPSPYDTIAAHIFVFVVAKSISAVANAARQPSPLPATVDMKTENVKMLPCYPFSFRCRRL